MKVAIPDWLGRVSPVFDVAACVILVDFDDQSVESGRRTEEFGSLEFHERAHRLSDLGVDVLVCGAISRPLEALLQAAGIRVVPLICGPIEKVVEAVRNRTIENGQFAMPGCCRRRRRRRGRCGRGDTAL